jgi:hypothetical protein
MLNYIIFLPHVVAFEKYGTEQFPLTKVSVESNENCATGRTKPSAWGDRTSQRSSTKVLGISAIL